MNEPFIGVIGARSFVGERIRFFLQETKKKSIAFSRKKKSDYANIDDFSIQKYGAVADWIYVAPIWTLKEHYSFLEKCGCRRLVVLSSTSRYSKITSTNPKEKKIAEDLIAGEESAITWAVENTIGLIILQPTMIYGYGKDENISNIIRFIKKFGFFPILGEGRGLRQPIHVDDVAYACISALRKCGKVQGRFIIAGKEVMSYQQMVERIFETLGKRKIIIKCPVWIFAVAVRILRLLPRYKMITTEMACRMNKDLDFSYEKARNDLDFEPRKFLAQNFEGEK